MEAKVKILFIDDDITFGRICTIILQEKGYEVFYQTTLNGAKACIAEAHPDIIVLDVEIGMGTAINPAIHSISGLVLMCVVPLNLLKGGLVSLITILVYKKLSPILKAAHKQ